MPDPLDNDEFRRYFEFIVRPGLVPDVVFSLILRSLDGEGCFPNAAYEFESLVSMKLELEDMVVCFVSIKCRDLLEEMSYDHVWILTPKSEFHTLLPEDAVAYEARIFLGQPISVSDVSVASSGYHSTFDPRPTDI